MHMNNLYYFRFVVKHSNYGLLKDFRKCLKRACNRNKELFSSTLNGGLKPFLGDSYWTMDVIDLREDWDKLIHMEKVKDIGIHKAKFNGSDSLIVDDPYYWPRFGCYDIANHFVYFEDDKNSFYNSWSLSAHTLYNKYVWSFFSPYTKWEPDMINDSNIASWEKALYGIYKRIKIGKVGDFVCMRSLL